MVKNGEKSLPLILVIRLAAKVRDNYTMQKFVDIKMDAELTVLRSRIKTIHYLGSVCGTTIELPGLR